MSTLNGWIVSASNKLSRCSAHSRLPVTFERLKFHHVELSSGNSEI